MWYKFKCDVQDNPLLRVIVLSFVTEAGKYIYLGKCTGCWVSFWQHKRTFCSTMPLLGMSYPYMLTPFFSAQGPRTKTSYIDQMA
jgi:hypothetical protein